MITPEMVMFWVTGWMACLGVMLAGVKPRNIQWLKLTVLGGPVAFAIWPFLLAGSVMERMR